ncbi:MAG: hypothetical protein ACRD5J_15250, partial [Nitrososphaeraceae archaeon]
ILYLLLIITLLLSSSSFCFNYNIIILFSMIIRRTVAFVKQRLANDMFALEHWSHICRSVK